MDYTPDDYRRAAHAWFRGRNHRLCGVSFEEGREGAWVTVQVWVGDDAVPAALALADAQDAHFARRAQEAERADD